MTKSAPRSGKAHGIPWLPEKLTTKDGQILNTQGDVWWLRVSVDGGGRKAIDFRSLKGLATRRFIAILKAYAARRARTQATSSLSGEVNTVARAVRFWHSQFGGVRIDWAGLRISHFQALLAEGLAKKGGGDGDDFSCLRRIYAWGAQVASMSDFDPQLALALKGIKAPGARKGKRVLSSNPEEGPFSPEEVELIDDAIKQGKGDAGDLIITQIFHELGIRPIQIMRARRSGLHRYEARIVESGIPRVLVSYTLDIPKAKSRKAFRIEEARPISSSLGVRIELYCPETSSQETRLCHWLSDLANGDTLNYVVQRWIGEVGIISPRTNKPLKAHPTRFRYSIATEAARDGASPIELAHLLFHTDLQNVEVYFDAAGTVMDQIEERLEKAFGPHIVKFLGRVASISDPHPHSGLDRRIVPGVFPQIPQAPILPLGIGACGQNVELHGLCRLAPPLSCYRCPKFAAFREADHQSIADSLEEIAKTSFGGQADARIGGELVLTIHAMRDLIRQISDDG